VVAWAEAKACCAALKVARSGEIGKLRPDMRGTHQLLKPDSIASDGATPFAAVNKIVIILQQGREVVTVPPWAKGKGMENVDIALVSEKELEISSIVPQLVTKDV
jgi:hypothetical protein